MNNIFRLSVLLIIFTLFTNTTFCKDLLFRGKIFFEGGQTESVIISVLGMEVKTVCDITGKFSIVIPELKESESVTLRFSCKNCYLNSLIKSETDTNMRILMKRFPKEIVNPWHRQKLGVIRKFIVEIPIELREKYTYLTEIEGEAMLYQDSLVITIDKLKIGINATNNKTEKSFLHEFWINLFEFDKNKNNLFSEYGKAAPDKRTFIKIDKEITPNLSFESDTRNKFVIPLTDDIDVNKLWIRFELTFDKGQSITHFLGGKVIEDF